MKWIGQHIYDLVARFRNDVYLEDISTGTIASGGNLGLDSNNKIVKQSDTGITDLHGAGVDGANNQLLTDDGDGTVTSESNLTFDGSTLSLTGALSVTGDAVTFTSANADDPAVIIQNTANDNQAARLQFIKNRGAAGQDADNVAELDFYSYNDAGTPELQQYGKMAYKIDDATDGQESGKFQAWVATHDGDLRQFLLGIGGSTSNETDVTLGNGAASVTTIAGTLTMGSTAAMTNAGLLSVANQTGITGLGTISSGVWNGTAIASAYLDADTAHLSGTQTFTGTKGFTSAEGTTFLRIVQDGDQTLTPGDGAAIHVDTSDITDNNTSASGTAAIYTHVNIEAPRLLATNASVTTTDAATLYIKSAPSASTNQTITNAYALWVDAGNARFDGDIDLEGDIDVNGTLETDALTIGGAAVLAQATASAVGAVELATTGEADTGTDTARAVTPAGLKSHVDARYSYAYMVWSASGVSTLDGSDPEWVFPNTSKGIYEEDWNKDEGIKATSVGATTYTVTRFSAVNGLVVPHTGVCVGFHAHGRNDDSDVAFKAGLFHLEGSTSGATNNGGVDYGNTGITHEATLRFIATAEEGEASGGASGTSGHSFKGPCKLVSNTDALTVTAGDVLLPAIMGPDASDEIFITMTIILKVPLTT
jgi:hypothetical protein